MCEMQGFLLYNHIAYECLGNETAYGIQMEMCEGCEDGNAINFRNDRDII